MLNQLDWIVIPGGPGLSYKYLKYGLAQPFINCKLHYYCIDGAPESNKKNVNLSDMVKQIADVAKKLNLSNYGLITHSFGNYLAMRVLEAGASSIKAIIMLNPMPFTSESWKKSLTSIINTVPVEIMEEINMLSNQADTGSQLFQLIYRYYISKKHKNMTLPVPILFDIEACNNIAAQVPVYDDRLLVTTANTPLIRLVGEDDPFFTDQKLLAEQTIVISNTGHYPFFEDQIKFKLAVSKIEELLCL